MGRFGSSARGRALRVFVSAWLLTAVAGCGGGGGGSRGVGLEDLNGDGQIIILCFGDSITRGTGDGGSATATPPLPAGYPARLQPLLGVVVTNAGVPGERARDGSRRLPGELQRSNPDYVILLEGTNDLMERGGNEALRNLRKMVETVFASGAFPILGTLPPACCSHGNALPEPIVRDFNAQLVALAGDLGVPVIDFFEAFLGGGPSFDSASGLIHVPEGLHPTPAGYDLMAETAGAIF